MLGEPDRWSRGAPQSRGALLFCTALFPGPPHFDNPDRRREALTGGRLLLNPPDDVQARDDPPERCGPLSILEPLAAEIERRLIVEQNKEIRRCRIRPAPRHRYRADQMFEAGHVGPLERNGPKAV